MRRAEPTPLPPPMGRRCGPHALFSVRALFGGTTGGTRGSVPICCGGGSLSSSKPHSCRKAQPLQMEVLGGGGGSPSPTFPSTVTPGDPTKGEAPRTDEVPTPFPSPSHGYRRLRTSCSSASSCALRAAPSPSLAITQSKGTPWSRPHSDSASSTPGEEQSPQNGSESPTLCSVLWGFMQKLRVLQPGGGCGDGGWQWGQEMAAGKRDRYRDRGWL